MISVDILQEDIKEAKRKSEEMGALRNSITEGKGNVIGFLGELIFARYFKGKIENTYHYDVILNGKKIDVKTKSTTVEPRPNYYASVAATNIGQKCDYYYFMRIKTDLSKAYLLGGYEKKEFFKDATRNEKGEIDLSSHLKWTFKEDCYNLEISKLKGKKN